MDWKKIYEGVVENICKRDLDDFDSIVEQPRPPFEDKLIADEKSTGNELYSKRLDESVAEEKDYKDFCEYIYNYIGDDVYNYISEGKKFSSFKKPNKEE